MNEEQKKTVDLEVQQNDRIKNLVELFSVLPEEERVIVDVLRQIILENLPPYGKEKIFVQCSIFLWQKSHLHHLARNHSAWRHS